LTSKVISLQIKPGIQRDGTLFDAPTFVDGKWVRFQRSRPRKMGGYRGIFLNASGISRGMIMNSENGLNYVYSGWSNGVEQWVTDNDDGVGSGPTSIGFIGDIVTLTNLVGGSAYTNGAYLGVALTGGTGAGATANITVSGGAVSVVTIVNDGANYTTGDVLSATAASIGGTGSGFSITIATTNSFTPSSSNLWQFDIGYDTTGAGNVQLVAHPGLNLVNIDNITNTPVLVADFPTGTFRRVVDSAGSTPTNAVIEVSGGCVLLHPYLFVYGNDGFIKNSSAGNFFDWNSADANETNVATGKIVKGLPVRGGTTSPSGLFWSTDSVIRVSYNPTTVGASTFYWRYDIITSQSSILSSSCVIEYDGLFMWCGVDRFLMYNGVVQEIPNTMNINFFFDNLNYSQRQKVWASKVPRWGEIWWFYPSGDSTECNNAIIFNIREQVWYDTGGALGARRSAGVFTEVFRKPIWAGNEENVTGNYTLWQHETGTDVVYLNSVTAVQSYFETNNIGWVTGGPGADEVIGPNRWIRMERVEPDFNQTGDMNLYVTGKGYAEDVDQSSSPYTFSPNTLKIDMREQRREMRLRFESNTTSGNYEQGQILLSADIGDERSTGNP
jgi:hypothetical protein